MSEAVRLSDEDFDDMHHAIGRKGTKDAYRNYYCTTAGGPQARNFEASPYWDFRTFINDGRDGIYAVNMKGLHALEKWLKGRAALNPQTEARVHLATEQSSTPIGHQK